MKLQAFVLHSSAFGMDSLCQRISLVKKCQSFVSDYIIHDQRISSEAEVVRSREHLCTRVLPQT